MKSALVLFLSLLPLYGSGTEAELDFDFARLGICRYEMQKLAPEVPEAPSTSVVVATPSELRSAVLDARTVTNSRFSPEERKKDPEGYRRSFQDQLAHERAGNEATQAVAKLIEEGKLSSKDERAIVAAFNQIYQNHLTANGRQTVLFLDTPVETIHREGINSDQMTLVVDHHLSYAPPNGLDNTGAQIIQRLRAAADKNPGETAAAVRDFQRSLFGEDPGRVTLSADNLADGAEVIAMVRNPELNRRIIENPETAKMLTESGRFTDFYLFGGDGYERGNTGAQSQNAIALSKALLHQHSLLLREYGIHTSDRIEGLKNPEKEAELLKRATDEAEKLLLEATRPGFNLQAPSRVKELAEAFDAARGTPGLPSSARTSLDAARDAHRRFDENTVRDLTFSYGLRYAPNSRAGGNERDLRSRAEALEKYVFGHEPVFTAENNHVFANWQAASMANQHPAPGQTTKPLKLELGGVLPADKGQIVVLAKAGEANVNLSSVGEALNARAQGEKRAELMAQGMDAARAAEKSRHYNPFTVRGNPPNLLFNFGGHNLSRAQVRETISGVLSQNGKIVVPSLR